MQLTQILFLSPAVLVGAQEIMTTLTVNGAPVTTYPVGQPSAGAGEMLTTLTAGGQPVATYPIGAHGSSPATTAGPSSTGGVSTNVQAEPSMSGTTASAGGSAVGTYSVPISGSSTASTTQFTGGVGPTAAPFAAVGFFGAGALAAAML